MKPFKTLGGVALSVSALIFATSCNKSLDEKGDRDVAMLETSSCGNCGPFINLQTKQGSSDNFFWIGAKNDMAGRQGFSGTNFSDNKYFDVTAMGGSPNLGNNGGIGVMGAGETGVNMNAINVGESLSLKLSSCMANYLMTGFDMILHAGNTTGTMELKVNGVTDTTLTFTSPSGPSKNFGVSYLASFTENVINYFDEIVISVTAGRVQLQGFQPNANQGLLKPGRFYLANVQEAVRMRNAAVAGGTYYINQGEFPAEVNTADRQFKETGNGDGFGNYATGTGKEWLVLSSNQGGLVHWEVDGNRIGVLTDKNDPLQTDGRYIDQGEELIITPGADFPSTHFDAFEFRVASQSISGQVLNVELYDGATMVGSGMSLSGDQTYALFYGTRPFDKIVIKGSTAAPANRIGVGRPGVRVLTAFPACYLPSNPG
ncbi:MAG: hypothetical protein MUE71_08020 [Chitinophagaceae bacterium]|jgi:hypothetical protein|nr:hypothetical protein [Chitinophagaceae bacterium]